MDSTVQIFYIGPTACPLAKRTSSSLRGKSGEIGSYPLAGVSVHVGALDIYLVDSWRSSGSVMKRCVHGAVLKGMKMKV